jgi:hypothetical protein
VFISNEPLSSLSKSFKAFEIAPFEENPNNSAISFAINQGSLLTKIILMFCH